MYNLEIVQFCYQQRNFPKTSSEETHKICCSLENNCFRKFCILLFVSKRPSSTLQPIIPQIFANFSANGLKNRMWRSTFSYQCYLLKHKIYVLKPVKSQEQLFLVFYVKKTANMLRWKCEFNIMTLDANSTFHLSFFYTYPQNTSSCRHWKLE